MVNQYQGLQAGEGRGGRGIKNAERKEMEGVRIRLTIKPPHSDLQKREGGEMGDEERAGGGRRKREPTSTMPLFPLAGMFIGVWVRAGFNYESADAVGSEGKITSM